MSPRSTPTIHTHSSTPTLTPQPSIPTLTPPQATPTLTPQQATPTLTPQQTSSLMPLLDPTTAQLVAGMTGSSPIILLPSGGNVLLMQTQPFFLVNPTDFSGLQQVSTAPNLMGTSTNFINAAAAMGSIIPNSSTGGYIVIPPGTSFHTPLMNLAGINGSQQPELTYVNHLHTPPAIVTKPLTISTQAVQPQSTITSGVSQRSSSIPLNTVTVTTVNPLKRTSRAPSISDKNDKMNHFAKALGDQWSKLQSNNLQSETVSAAQPYYL